MLVHRFHTLMTTRPPAARRSGTPAVSGAPWCWELGSGGHSRSLGRPFSHRPGDRQVQAPERRTSLWVTRRGAEAFLATTSGRELGARMWQLVKTLKAAETRRASAPGESDREANKGGRGGV